MSSVLVCVRTPIAAQTIATSASRLGVGGAVRTALTTNEVLTHLAAAPADLVLADTALSRPDSADFVRRVLAAAPGATLVLFGPEEPRMAAAAVSAGARGVIRGDHGDPVTLVAKALLLLFSHGLFGRPGTPPGSRDGAGRVAGAGGTAPAGTGLPAGAGPINSVGPAGTGPAGGTVPLGAGTGRLGPAARPASLASQSASALPAAVPQQRGDLVPEGTRRRVELTERELQVLRGMADGKSNAEIGRELFVSEDTVKTHARRLFRKLGARDRAHAVASAFRAGLVS